MVVFHVFKWCKLYEIAQSITYMKFEKIQEQKKLVSIFTKTLMMLISKSIMYIILHPEAATGGVL